MTSAPYAVSARADRGASALGEPFTVEVTLRHGPASRWHLATPQAPSPYALRSGSCATEDDGSDARTVCRVLLAREELGDAPASLALVSGDARVEVALPPVRAALVTSPAVPARELPLAGLAPPPQLLVETWRPLALAAGALAGALALGLVASRLRRTGRGRAAAPAPSPARALLARVDALAAGPRGRALFSALAEALHGYAADAAGLPARALTDRELAERLEATRVPGLEGARVRAFADLAERVRFAGAEPSPAECDAALALVRAVAREGGAS